MVSVFEELMQMFIHADHMIYVDLDAPWVDLISDLVMNIFWSKPIISMMNCLIWNLGSKLSSTGLCLNLQKRVPLCLARS